MGSLWALQVCDRRPPPNYRWNGINPLKNLKKKNCAIIIGYSWAFLRRRTNNSISTPYPENYPERSEIVDFGVPRTRFFIRERLSSDRTATVHSPLLPVLDMPHELWSAVNRSRPETIVISLCLKRAQSIAELIAVKSRDTWAKRDNCRGYKACTKEWYRNLWTVSVTRSAHPKTLQKLKIERTLKNTVLADTYNGSKKWTPVISSLKKICMVITALQNKFISSPMSALRGFISSKIPYFKSYAWKVSVSMYCNEYSSKLRRPDVMHTHV